MLKSLQNLNKGMGLILLKAVWSNSMREYFKIRESMNFIFPFNLKPNFKLLFNVWELQLSYLRNVANDTYLLDLRWGLNEVKLLNTVPGKNMNPNSLPGEAIPSAPSGGGRFLHHSLTLLGPRVKEQWRSYWCHFPPSFLQSLNRHGLFSLTGLMKVIPVGSCWWIKAD